MTSALRIGISTVTLVLIGVGVVLFALNGYAPLIAVVGGVWLSVVPIMLLFGAPMAVAPGRMIRWREAAWPKSDLDAL
jgi:hypothetical protein